ncbi:MAG: hypothetical protein ACRET2_02215 [Steroidobacteraceae bacterium]
MLLFPPFHVVLYHYPPLNLGYAWLFAPPRDRASVDVETLSIQLIGALIVIALVCSALPTRARTDTAGREAIEASERIIEAVLESDAAKLRTALSDVISVEIARRR